MRGGKRRLDVRRVLSGARRSVLHMPASTVTGEGLSPYDPVAHDAAQPKKDAAKSWATSWATVRARVVHVLGHGFHNGDAGIDDNGPLGPPQSTGESPRDACGSEVIA
jgi:hypothetical protein